MITSAIFVVIEEVRVKEAPEDSRDHRAPRDREGRPDHQVL
jgi:hypothetical protein